MAPRHAPLQHQAFLCYHSKLAGRKSKPLKPIGYKPPPSNLAFSFRVPSQIRLGNCSRTHRGQNVTRITVGKPTQGVLSMLRFAQLQVKAAASHRQTETREKNLRRASGYRKISLAPKPISGSRSPNSDYT